MQGAQVQSLVGELRSLMLSGVAKQTSKHTPSFPYRHPAQTLPLWAYGIGLRWSAHPRAPLSNDVCPGPLLAHLSCALQGRPLCEVRSITKLSFPTGGTGIR